MQGSGQGGTGLGAKEAEGNQNLGLFKTTIPAESNLDQMTHLISPARSELSQIDPSWEIRALSADWIGTPSQYDASCDAACTQRTLCADPRAAVYRFGARHRSQWSPGAQW